MKYRKYIAWALLFIFLGLSVLPFFSCKTPQNVEQNTHYDEQKNLSADVSTWNEAQLREAIYRAMQAVISERVDLSIEQKDYDTGKPIDSITGKPPLASEKKINLKKNTDSKINDDTGSYKDSTSTSSMVDKTKDKGHVEVDSELDKESPMPLWQKIAIVIVVIVTLGLIEKFKK